MIVISELIRIHSRGLLRYAFAYLQDKNLAHQCVMHTFRLAKDNSEEVTTGWLFRSCRMQCFNAFKANFASKATDEDIIERFSALNPIDDGDPAQDNVRRALRTLPGELREILWLRFSAGINYNDVGVALGLNPLNMSVQMTEAIRQLAQTGMVATQLVSHALGELSPSDMQSTLVSITSNPELSSQYKKLETAVNEIRNYYGIQPQDDLSDEEKAGLLEGAELAQSSRKLPVKKIFAAAVIVGILGVAASQYHLLAESLQKNLANEPAPQSPQGAAPQLPATSTPEVAPSTGGVAAPDNQAATAEIPPASAPESIPPTASEPIKNSKKPEPVREVAKPEPTHQLPEVRPPEPRATPRSKASPQKMVVAPSPSHTPGVPKPKKSAAPKDDAKLVQAAKKSISKAKEETPLPPETAVGDDLGDVEAAFQSESNRTFSKKEQHVSRKKKPTEVAGLLLPGSDEEKRLQAESHPVAAKDLKAAQQPAARTGEFYQIRLAMKQTWVSPSIPKAKALKFINNVLQGNQDCIPRSINIKEIPQPVRAQIELAGDGSIIKIKMLNKMTGAARVAKCLQERLGDTPADLKPTTNTASRVVIQFTLQ